MLGQHGLDETQIQELLQPLGELMTTLRDVKLADVTYLELQPFDEQTWSRDSYNEAIVSIFTRLNTAGRTLTREEITLAWLKVGWETSLTEGKSAGECFNELQTLLADQQLPLETDELVSAASFVWAVAHNEGRLLANSDLLKGTVIRPMAAALSREWQAVVNSFLLGSRTLNQRMIEYGPRGQFSSLYALAVLWAWIYIAESWKDNQPLGELERDDFEKRCRDSIAKYLDRWIMCSQWAGVWSSASVTTIEAYAKALNEVGKNMRTARSSGSAHEVWDACFAKFLEGLANEASNYVNTVSAGSRERVTVYRSVLWVWHRLDADRWAKSKIQLRVGKSKVSTEVDHTVSFGLWERKISEVDDIDKEQALPLVNRLGNCALFEKNFNISKSDKTLKSFLSQIHEVLQNKIQVDAWCAAMAISLPILDPTNATIVEVEKAIENRDIEIRSDLVEFVKGQRVRVDVATPLPLVADESEGSSPEQLGESAATLAVPRTELADSESANELKLDQNDGSLLVTDLNGLAVAYTQDANVRLIIDHFANRQNNQYITEIETLLNALARAGTPSEKTSLIHAFRRLDALGIGRFVAGRRGHPTRFEWREKSLTVREMASGYRR